LASISRIPRLAAAAAVLALAAVAAQAQQISYRYFMAGISTGLMSVSADPDHTGSTGWMVGYRFNKNVGIQAIGYTANSPFHQRPPADGSALYDFEHYEGLQVVGFIPATSDWDIFGGIGAGRATYGTATPGFGSRDKTDGLVEAGVRWQVVPHFAVSTEIQRVMDAQSTNGTLRAEVNF
jgi:hypothetical protein